MTQTTKHEFNFDFSPQVIRLLGEELIHDKKIAICELVKNAYDADAQNVKITVGGGQIVIEDDGCGMNADIIRDHWLKPGNSSKTDKKFRTPKFRRVPLGEKGVGRLGVHRLGNHIAVVSKDSKSKEVEFEINWENFDNVASVSELPSITVKENETPVEFENKQTGTKLTIKQLREPFNDKDMESLNEDLIKFISPFQQKTNRFNIEFADNRGLFHQPEQLGLNHLLEKAFFHFKVGFEKGKITQFDYSFTPPEIRNLKGRKIALKGVDKHLLVALAQDQQKDVEENQQEWLFCPENSVDIGEVFFQGHIFEPRYARSFKCPIDKEASEYLKKNGGIRVYRDGLRVYNYGEGGRDNDILNLDRKRAKKLGDNIGYNQILAAIEIDLANSRELKEKTNREGFIHNKAFLYLQQGLDYCMELVSHHRKLDRAEMEAIVLRQDDKGDLDRVLNRANHIVERSQLPEKDKAAIYKEISGVRDRYKQLKDIFLVASNTGLNMSFIVHEIDKIIDHLEHVIQKQKWEQVNSVFEHLKNTIDAYKEVIRLEKKQSNHQLSSLLEQSVFNAQYRFESHKIDLKKDWNNDLHIKGKRGLIIGIINNIFDNSIYWLNFYKIQEKKILIKTYQQDQFNVILIADSGKGFNISFEAALAPFVTGRADESSMGIGLHLASQVMEAHGGIIEEGNWKDEGLPKEFSDGAIIKLKFPIDKEEA